MTELDAIELIRMPEVYVVSTANLGIVVITAAKGPAYIRTDSHTRD